MQKYIAPESDISWYVDDPLIESDGGAIWPPEEEFTEG